MVKKTSDPKVASKGEIEDTLNQIRKSSVLLIVLIVAIALLFIGLTVFSFLDEDREPTLEELYQQTLDGVESDTNFLYNGYTFIYDGFFWIVRIGKDGARPGLYSEFNIPFYYNARQVENVSYQNGTRNAVLGKDLVYFTQDPEQPAEVSLAVIEVGRIVGTKYGLLGIPTKATVTQNPAEGEPAITCQNVSRNVGVIYFRIANQTRVYAEDGCVIVEGATARDVIQAADRLSFAMMNIIPDSIAPEEDDTLESIASTTIDNITIEVRRVQLTQNLVSEGIAPAGFEISDVADGVYYVPLLVISNAGDEPYTFTPAMFRLRADNQTYSIDYQSQRFVPGKINLQNTVNSRDAKFVQIAYDLPRLYREVTLLIRVGSNPVEELTIPIAET